MSDDIIEISYIASPVSPLPNSVIQKGNKICETTQLYKAVQTLLDIKNDRNQKVSNWMNNLEKHFESICSHNIYTIRHDNYGTDYKFQLKNFMSKFISLKNKFINLLFTKTHESTILNIQNSLNIIIYDVENYAYTYLRNIPTLQVYAWDIIHDINEFKLHLHDIQYMI